MIPVRAEHKILIIASDPFLAAVVGSLVETTRLQAAFPKPAERPEEALTRVRPLAAILVDALVDGAASDLFLRRARRRGVRVMLFGSTQSIARRKAWALAHDVPAFDLPEQVEALNTELHRLLDPNIRDRGAERRAHTERGPNGTLIFEDGSGTRWSVYDRRAADRRRPLIQREFVSERGEVRRCRVSNVEARSTSVAALAEQLARAISVSGNPDEQE